MVYSVLYLWILGERVVWFCCWLVELRRYFFSVTQTEFASRVLFSVDLLIWNILSCIYESWEKKWCDFAVELLNWEQNIFQKLKNLIHGLFFPRWLVDMTYSILSCIYWSWEKGWCDFVVDLLNWADIHFQQLKKKVYRVFFSVDLLIWHILSTIYSSWKKGVVWFCCWISAIQEDCIKRFFSLSTCWFGILYLVWFCCWLVKLSKKNSVIQKECIKRVSATKKKTCM